jgi:anti-sigma factor RsiW
MNSISHIQARALLDSAADLSLSPGERDSLEEHLSACDECRRYAGELAEVEQALGQSLQTHQKASAVHLSVEEIMRHARLSQTPALRFASRFAAAPILLVVLLAITLTLGLPRLTGGTGPAQTSTAALLVPTPSARNTSTLLTMPECESLPYQVQRGDNLEGIAQKFSISKEILMAYNDLTAEPLPAQLDIPLCYATPLVGSQTPASTITLTPQAEFTLRTP